MGFEFTLRRSLLDVILTGLMHSNCSHPAKDKTTSSISITLVLYFPIFSMQASFSRVIELSNQYQALESYKNDLSGLYVLPREKDIFTWDGIVFISKGVWCEGIFKFTMKLPVQ